MTKSKRTSVPLFSPELRETSRRLKDKEPELTEIVEREGGTMTAKTKADGSLETRLEMHRLMVEEGLSDRGALRRVMPDDRNRWAKLKRWEEKGLWPLHENDLLPQDNSDIQRQAVNDGLSETELLRKVRAMVEGIEPAERPIGATAKGRKSPLQTTMIAIRIPTTLDDELKALHGPKSRHIEKAIMLYLRAMKAEGQDDA
jgi:hypothetical protein